MIIPSSSASRCLSLVMILGLLLINLVWLPFGELSFDEHTWLVLIITLLLVVLAIVFHQKFKIPSALVNIVIELFIVLMACWVGFVYSYLVISVGGILYDEQLVGIDKTLGFEWLGYSSFFISNNILCILSLVFYLLIPLLAIFSIMWFCFYGAVNRASALVSMLILGAVICITISGIFPGAGAVGYFLPDQEFYLNNFILFDGNYKQSFFDLRDGVGLQVSLLKPIALVSFPSFHACIGILTILIFREDKVMYWIMLILNSIGLLTIPIQGGHHLTDVLGGIVVAVLSYYLVILSGSFLEHDH